MNWRVCVWAALVGLLVALLAAGGPGRCGADLTLPASMGGGCELPDWQVTPAGAVLP